MLEDIITLDVIELVQLDTVEQAQRFEQVHRQIDDLQRSAYECPRRRKWAKQQRKYLAEMQMRLYVW